LKTWKHYCLSVWSVLLHRLLFRPLKRQLQLISKPKTKLC
jgi:hypothetical protein